MIKTIVFEYHFQPREIAEMYVDDFDFQGIIFWYKEFERLEKLRKKE
jgi:hypothetical protein